MIQQEKLIHLSNQHRIELRIEPNSDSPVYRLAVYNSPETHLKFLYNGKVYTRYEVFEANHCSFRAREKETYDVYSKEILDITEFGLASDKSLGKLIYSHEYYSHKEILGMVKILSPLLKNGFTTIPLKEYLDIDQKLAEYQKPLIEKINLVKAGKLTNYDIRLFVEPNSSEPYFRFAVLDKDETHVKFLYNNKIYEKEEVLKAQDGYAITYKLFRGEHSVSPILPVEEISVFGIKDCPRNQYDIRFFYHTHYTNDEIQKMIDIMSPILQGKYQLVSPQECLDVEAKLVDYQKRLDKVNPIELEKKATEDYLNFGDWQILKLNYNYNI